MTYNDIPNPSLQTGGFQRGGMQPRAILTTALAICLLILTVTSLAQSPLNTYIQEGLTNNLALKQKEINYEKSLEALKEAKGLFFPNISLNARYSVAEGGRTIDLPIGDMLNPVYSTLNQLIHQNLFPPIDNQSFMFMRPQEQETKIRMIQPLFNTDIYYNSIIKRELVETERTSIDQYKRELVADIKKAWYQTAMAEGILRMLENTRSLVEENVRVNQKLVDNGKITLDNLYRSQTEQSKFEQKIQEAKKNRKVAAAYLNFLVNRALTDPVEINDLEILPIIPDSEDMYTQRAMGNREELKTLQTYQRITDHQIRMNRAGALPNLMIVADYGIQGEKYRFNTDADFAQASALLTWDLFQGFQNRSKIKQSLLQKKMIETQTNEATNQIELQVIKAMSELETASQAITYALAQVKSAREGFRLVKRRYEEGQVNLIEFIDARTSLTQSEENLILSKYNYLIHYAEFEKVTGVTKY